MQRFTNVTTKSVQDQHVLYLEDLQRTIHFHAQAQAAADDLE